MANTDVFFGLTLFSAVVTALWWSSYQKSILAKKIRDHGIAIAADLNSAEKRNNSGDGPADLIINYSFVPAGTLRKIKVSKIVDMTTFERYRNATTVPILYLHSDPDNSDIVENDIVIWNFWGLGVMTFTLTLFWIGAIISTVSAQ